jgi:hypothetical protein
MSCVTLLAADFGNAGLDKDEVEELQEALLRELYGTEEIRNEGSVNLECFACFCKNQPLHVTW